MRQQYSSGGRYYKSEDTRLLDAIRYVLTLSKDYTAGASWEYIPGHSIQYTYYSGVAAGNPSGATTNVQTATYSINGKSQFTQTYTYNAANSILSITTA